MNSIVIAERLHHRPLLRAAVLQWRLVAAALTTLVFWSGSYIAISIAMRELSPAPFALARLGTAAIVLALVSPLFGRTVFALPRLKDLPFIALMAALGFPLYHTAINAGQTIVSAGVTSLLIATLPIFAAVIASIGLKEKLAARGWLGIAIAFAGSALLIAGSGKEFSFDSYALLVLLAAFLGAGFMVVQRFLIRAYSGIALTVWGIWIGSAMLLPFSSQLITELRTVSDATILSILYLGIFPTALSYVTWSYVLKMLPAARASSLLYFVPPITFVFAWLILGDLPSLIDIASGIIIIAGVALVQRAPRTPAKRNST